ncbi:MAG: type IX secretion system membrane protein PorP/SprF [Bacteroidetes bacterium]|nr:MAG: type IX secretion system membrane protein PorP/SprF [Bacteroidota bacterium]
MKLSRLLPVLLLWLNLGALSAQDIHYTLFNMAPLRTNPALTGAFEGTVRLGGIYRGQWFTVNGSGDIHTPSFYADAPIIRGFRDKDWVGVGLMFLQDNAGPFNLNTSIGGLSAAYHLALNKKGTSMLTIGGQYGQVQRGLDLSDNTPLAEINIPLSFGGQEMNFSDPLLGGGGMGGSTTIEKSINYTDISGGLLLRTELDKESSLELGVAALHLNTPGAGLGAGGTGTTPNQGARDSDRRMTMIAHGEYRRLLDEKWSISPTFFWQTTAGGGNEISLQAWANRKVNSDFTLNFGLGWRAADAAKILLGADYKDVRAALSYDINLSSANTITNYVGGFELAAYYIIKIYKEPDLTPKVLCPQF